ncbi:alpha/beta family hydrolase [Marinomonas sp. TW1]|uniref:alpha/beta family hydrolase n=1 Tax=Marinomonas sp. TW1 TaxID=1561203 RepID=UPI0007AF50BE|nr:alpha/beta family hydrolase [Marinomonas sp. TW1]KZN13201.1 hydrolase [Marinomonas sp. TW1]
MTLPFFLAHGAGAGHQSDFLTQLQQRLQSASSILVSPMTFDYMSQQEATRKRRPPPQFKTLVAEYENRISSETACIVSGKSMGGRVATQLSKHEQVKAIVCYGFPFYPPRKPEKHRLLFLEGLEKPCLIIQGTRDPLGNLDWVSQQVLPSNVEIHWVDGADHDFKVLKKYNKTQNEVIEEIAQLTIEWLQNKQILSSF